MEKPNYTSQQEHLAQLCKAMGHPARMAILELLASQHSCCFGDIEQVMPLSKATVSQHLSELKASGLVRCENEGVKVFYSIDRENWRGAKLTFNEFFSNIYRERGIL